MSIQITPVDKTLEKEGTWVKYYDVELLIARGNNDNYSRVFTRLSKPYKRQIESGSLPEETAESILFESMAEGLLLDWKGLKVAGKEVPYTKENAFSLMQVDTDCREFVVEYSNAKENYYKEDLEQMSGKP